MQLARRISEACGLTWPEDRPERLDIADIDRLCECNARLALELYATVLDPDEGRERVARALARAKDVPRVADSDAIGQAAILGEMACEAYVAGARRGIVVEAVAREVCEARLRAIDPPRGAPRVDSRTGEQLTPHGWVPPDVPKALRNASFEYHKIDVLKIWLFVFLGFAGLYSKRAT